MTTLRAYLATRRTVIRQVIGIWLAWSAILLAFQALVPLRLDLARPDFALNWTPNETRRNSQNDKPYLIEPFLNAQVSWDSEFYLSIATRGYDDPLVRSVDWNGRRLSLNYAFLPFYPALIAVAAAPLAALGLTPIATSTLAGVLVSLAGALFAMLAIAELAFEPDRDGGQAVRSALYLLVFPTGFFLAQVFTESVFIALSLWCIATARRGHWPVAALLAILATWTRASGLALLIPLAWLAVAEAMRFRREGAGIASLRRIVPFLAALAPVAAYALWRASWLGTAFAAVEQKWFGREMFAVGKMLNYIGYGLGQLTGANTQSAIYFALEFAAVALVVAATATMLIRRRHVDVALFSAAILIGTTLSGTLQSNSRYVLTMPVVFIWLAWLGRSMVFDRAWSLASTLLMGMLAMLFTFDMWVA